MLISSVDVIFTQQTDCLYLSYIPVVIKDPCVTYTKLDNAEKRSTGFLADWTSEESISDDMLKEGWYRVYSDNGGDMPTTQLPETKYCGTINPVWLNGIKQIYFTVKCKMV